MSGTTLGEPGPTLREVVRGGYFLDALRDAGRVAIAPARWDAGDWAVAAGVAGTTWGISTVDNRIRRAFLRNRSSGTRQFAAFGKRFGDGAYVAPALVVGGVGGHFAGDAKLERAAWLGLESLGIAAGFFDTIIKFLAHRHRPYTGDGPRVWDGPGTSRQDGRLSFPSGHACTAFSALTAISAVYDDAIWIAPAAYGIATLTALSRIHDDMHWASDAFFGSALGFFTARAVVAWHAKAGEGVAPAVLPGGIPGVALTYRF
jgi:membrane-associated phospholipid phosphatase